MDSSEQALLRAALQYLSQRYGAGYTLRGVSCVVVGPDGVIQRLVLRPSGLVVPGEGTSADTRRTWTDTEQAILDVLARAGRALKGQAIATRAGRPYNPHFRQTLSRLKQAGVLAHTSDGYQLAVQPDIST